MANNARRVKNVGIWNEYHRNVAAQHPPTTPFLNEGTPWVPCKVDTPHKARTRNTYNFPALLWKSCISIVKYTLQQTGPEVNLSIVEFRSQTRSGTNRNPHHKQGRVLEGRDGFSQTAVHD